MKQNFFEEENDEGSRGGDYHISDSIMAEFNSSRNILIEGDITKQMAFKVMLLLLHMDQESDTEPIMMYIDSPGGVTSAGFTIIDVMKIVKAPIYTICFGDAASMAALILTSGTKGKRFCTEHGTVMIHQPWMSLGAGMKQTDIESVSKSIKHVRDESEDILAETTGNTKEFCSQAMERDNYLDPEEALKMGLIDKILIGSKQGMFAESLSGEGDK